MNPIRPLAIALALTVAAAPAAAQQRVYQWKDAKGVTHYTDVPPPGRATRPATSRSRTASRWRASAKQPESEQCTKARGNVARLQAGGPIGIDTNGDGKPDRNMGADEHKAQLELNQAAVKAFCMQAKP